MRRARRQETCGQAWIALLRHVWSAGEAGLGERGPIIEGPPVLLEVASLSWDDPIIREHGDRDQRDRAGIDRAGVVRAGHERTRRSVRGVYGPRLNDLNGVDQVRWVVDLLRARPWTTSAWISLTLPGEQADGVPCLTALSFRIRGYRLFMTATFRSQNVYRGYLTYIPLRGVQLEVAEQLGLPAGPLRLYVDVPHIAVAEVERVAAVLTSMPEPNAA